MFGPIASPSRGAPAESDASSITAIPLSVVP